MSTMSYISYIPYLYIYVFFNLLFEYLFCYIYALRCCSLCQKKRYDDGDELDNLKDCYVMKSSEYLLSIRKSTVVASSSSSGGDENGNNTADDDDDEPKWIGVKNKCDQNCIADDEWARDVG